jgi:hypothetical protein
MSALTDAIEHQLQLESGKNSKGTQNCEGDNAALAQASNDV